MVLTHPRIVARPLTFVLVWLLAVGAFFFAAPTLARAVDSATISGVVTDSVSGEGLAGVVVADATGAVTATSSDTGAYSLTVAPGSYDLTASRSGYVTGKAPTLALTAGAAATQNFALIQTASASGSVVAEGTGQPVASVIVKLFDAASNAPNALATAVTGADGQWIAEGLVPGDYRIQFDASETTFLSRWWDQQATRDDATLLTLVSGEARTGLNGELALGALISGTVRNEAGEPLQGADVQLSDNNNHYRYGYTDAAGFFEIRGVLPGQYRLSAQHQGYVTTWFGGAERSELAEYFSVPDAAVITGKDITLRIGGAIAGTLTVDDPTASASVSVNGPSHGWSSLPAGGGEYTVNDLAPGDYRVSFWASGYAYQYYNGTADYDAATLVKVTRGETTSGIDATMTTPPVPTNPSTLVGTVLDSSGRPVEGVIVSDYDNGSVVTDAAGTFSLTVQAKSYGYVYFEKDGYVRATWSGSMPENTDAEPTHAIAAPVLQREALITGTVTAGATPTPQANVEVVAMKATDGGYENWAGNAYTAADGTYTLRGLAAGWYTLRFTPGNDSPYATIYHAGAASIGLAAYFPVAEGAALTGMDATLSKAASLTGTVLTADGRPASGATVSVAATGSTRTITAGSDGAFTFGALAPANYRLSARQSDWAVSWWPTGTSSSAAELIPVGPGESLSGYRLTLAPGWTVSGTLRDATGALLVDREVVLAGVSDGRTTTVRTDEAGHFAFAGTPDGAYSLGVRQTTGYNAIVWLPGSTSQRLAGTFDVSGADVVRDIVEPKTATLTLTFNDELATPVPGVQVTVFQASQYVTGAWAESEGRAAVTLFPGAYRLRVSADGWLTQNVDVTIDGDTNRVITLSRGASIAGSVSGADSFTVIAYEVHTGATTLTSAAAGDYLMTGLPAGVYAVAFAPQGEYGTCGPATWYGGSSYFAATRLTLGATESRAGVDGAVACSVVDPTVVGSISGRIDLPAGLTFTDDHVRQIEILARGDKGAYGAQLALDGTFSFAGLPAGSYEITLYSSDGWIGAAPVTVTVTPGTAAEMTFTAWAKGSISGRVLDHFGAPLTSSSIEVQDESGNNVGWSSTSTDGTFLARGLDAGRYTLLVRTYQAPYVSLEVPATVALGETTALGDLRVPAGGRLVGTLPPLPPNTNVRVDVTDDTGHVLATRNFWNTTDYTFWVPAGTVYVRFGGDVVSEWWRDAATLSAATPIVVETGKAVPDINPELTVETVTEKGFAVSGRVSGPDGPTPWQTVWLMDAAGDIRDGVGTAADGTYTLRASAGTWTLVAQVCFGQEGDYDVACLGEQHTVRRDIEITDHDLVDIDLVVSGVADQPFTGTPTPVVTGNARVGETLSADPGTWEPVPDALAYQWAADGTPITEATGSSLLLTEDLTGKRITVTVTASKAGYTTLTRTSAPTAVVEAQPVPTVIPGTPAIAGVPVVGQTLTAQPGTWSPADAAFAYQWLRAGTPIEGATGSTYLVSDADLGATLSVRVTGSKDGYQPASATSAATDVVNATVVPGTPIVTGLAQVGQTLTVDPGTWTPADVSLTYQWRRGATSIEGATASSYEVQAADVDTTITVIVTGSKTGYTPASATSSPTATVQGGQFAVTEVPVISGTPTVGQELTVSTGSWAPEPSSYSYQWFRSAGGAEALPIQGATSAAYTIADGDLAVLLSVQVTGHRDGYNDQTVTAVALGPVAAGTFTASTPTVTGTPRVGEVLTATVVEWSPLPNYAWQWYRVPAKGKAKAIPGATTSSYTVSAADVGYRLVANVTGSRDGYQALTQASSPTGLVMQGQFTTTPTPVITGSPVVGQVLAVDSGAWAPAPDSFRYAWFRNGKAIGGAKAATYTATSKDAGATITVAVTVVKAGFMSVTVTSEGVQVSAP